jgi:hypothetical protein
MGVVSFSLDLLLFVELNELSITLSFELAFDC